MTKDIHENVWVKNNIPALEYCSIGRAIELLQCKLEDIIHFAEIGAIELALKLERYEASLTAPLEFRDNDIWEDGFPFPYFLNKYHVNNRLSLFVPMVKDETLIDTEKKPTHLYEYNEKKGIRKPLMNLYGLWVIKPLMMPDSPFFTKILSPDGVKLTPLDFYFKEADTENNSDTIMATPKSEYLYPDGNLDVSKLKPIVTLTINDLYLTKKQIDRIYNGIGNILPSYVTGDIKKTKSDNSIIKAEKLTVHQFSFIYGLLRLIGISEDEINRAPPSELNRILSTKAASKGIHFSAPDKNTWARWREKFPVK